MRPERYRAVLRRRGIRDAALGHGLHADVVGAARYEAVEGGLGGAGWLALLRHVGLRHVRVLGVDRHLGRGRGRKNIKVFFFKSNKVSKNAEFHADFKSVEKGF
jgi:hypothetical protein